MNLTPTQETKGRAAASPQASKQRPGIQPLDVINVPGALLKLPTLASLVGVHPDTLYRAARRGDLVLTKIGTRCTRVSSENARAYLARLAGEVTT